ncbi:hypothetical protein brsh051_01840 [Brooklawnia propionicigenes]|uniref:Phage capsid-like C-terminal domain-containing protein n=1 Tax=Brooklawnia propionicigenes TaxID=3041175 RepID=A0AAN0K5S0_9ACTN|nr:phage major capsid protein [Brooklawnia sp. SH051]BEH00903.1 hypothetical protein brsh051_01840 [Brooklawnia sp. SH051]
MLTTDANTAFLPEQIGDLIVKPTLATSVAAQAAHVVNTGDVAAYRVPIVAADPSAAWTAEGEQITTSAPVLDEIASPFYKLAGLTSLSRELADDTTPEAAELVGEGLARDIARQLDAAFFGTRGASTIQPAGLKDLTGVGTISAGSAWKDTDPFVSAIFAAANIGATITAFVANPADAELMAKVKKAAGSNEPLLGNDPTQPTRRQIAGVPLLTSPAVDAGTVWSIPQDRVILAVREGTTLEVDRSVYFGSDRIAVRAIMRVTFLFPHPSAIQKIELA